MEHTENIYTDAIHSKIKETEQLMEETDALFKIIHDYIYKYYFGAVCGYAFIPGWPIEMCEVTLRWVELRREEIIPNLRRHIKIYEKLLEIISSDL